MQKAKLKISEKLVPCDLCLVPKLGFTLLEILVMLVVLGFLVAMVTGRFAGFTQEAAITTTLSEMNSIKEAIRDRFYPDLGLIPEDTANPEWALRFLCFRHDGDISITWDGTSFIYAPNSGQSYQMARFLAEQLHIRLGTGNETVAASQAEALLNWDRYSRRGWRGPYMEREITARDTTVTPTEWYPLIIDAWGEEVDYSVDPDGVTGEYRIFGGQDRNLAQIVSYGADGEADSDVVIGTDGNDYVCIQPHTAAAVNRPISGADWADYWALDNTQSGGTWGTGTDYQTFGDDDLVMFIFGTGPIRRP